MNQYHTCAHAHAHGHTRPLPSSGNMPQALSSLSSPLMAWPALLTPVLSAARSTATGSSCTRFRWPSSSRTTSSSWTCRCPQLQVRHGVPTFSCVFHQRWQGRDQAGEGLCSGRGSWGSWGSLPAACPQTRPSSTSASWPAPTTTASPGSGCRSSSENTSRPRGRSCSPGSLRTGKTGTRRTRDRRALQRGAALSPVRPCLSSPRFLQRISDPRLRVWAEQLHQLWKKLGKKVKLCAGPREWSREARAGQT